MNSKKKGNEGERELLHLLEHIGGVAVWRNQQGYVGGAGNPDLQLTIGNKRFHMEVKRTERFQPYAAYEQAVRDARNAIPIVAHRHNFGGWMVFLSLDDLLEVARVRKRTCKTSAGESLTIDF